MAMIHVNRAGTNLGIFPEEDVREGLRAGRFAPTDLGWREGMAQWQALSQFPEFGADIPTGATAPSPTVPPVTSTIPAPISLAPAPRSGLPWDQRQTRGFFNAYFETLVMVLTKPGQAFTAMKREGGLADPLLYALIGGSFGLIVYFLFMFLMPSLVSLGGRDNPLGNLIGAGVGSIFLIILVPLFIVIGAFITAAILHVCLMIVGGAKQSFETTFRVVCFSMGSVDPLLIIPFCGGLIATVWRIVLNCIGLARAHETDTGRAVLAVFLPLIVCCGIAFICALLIPALFHHANQ
jgi:hypothetical protein